MISKDLIIHASARDLGSFTVYRALPTLQKKSIGPFIFLDQMGPLELSQTRLLDVRPHPHIGLATVTYLFEGDGFHRDSIGSQQLIVPGDINLMIAGNGIVHSERTPEKDRVDLSGKTLHGIQIWVGLPREHEECMPEFLHYSADEIPQIPIAKQSIVRLLMGSWQGYASPVKCFSRTLLIAIDLTEATSIELDFAEEELGCFIATGQVDINGHQLNANDLFIPLDSQKLKFATRGPSKIIIIGGSPFPEKRYLWWNFVATDRQRIKQAALKWEKQEMGTVPGETEYMPLPQHPLP